MSDRPVLRRGYDAYTPPKAEAAWAAGYRFGLHYLGGAPDKDLADAERRADHAVGLDVGLNYEGDSSDANGGFSGGVNSANLANTQADSLGAPSDGSVWLYYSVDTSGIPADKIRAYFEGIASVKGRPAGGYGGTDLIPVLDAGLIKGWWQAQSGGWSGWPNNKFPTHTRACIRQWYPSKAFDATRIDENDQMTVDCGFWLSPHSSLPHDLGGNLMAFGPSGTRVDTTVVGVDGRPYRAWADSPAALVNAEWTELGGPAAAALDILKDGWLADGSDYVVIAKGTNSKVYIWTDSSQKWQEMVNGMVG